MRKAEVLNARNAAWMQGEWEAGAGNKTFIKRKSKQGCLPEFLGTRQATMNHGWKPFVCGVRLGRL